MVRPIFFVAAAAAVLMISITITTNVYAGQPGNAGDCYEMGYDDGKNRPFKQYKFEDCEGERFKKDGKNQYYEGFIDGCKSVEGNTEEICERNIE